MKYLRLYENINFDEWDEEEFDEDMKYPIDIKKVKRGDFLYARDTFYMQWDRNKTKPFIIKDEPYEIKYFDYDRDGIVLITNETNNHYFNNGSYNKYFYIKK